MECILIYFINREVDIMTTETILTEVTNLILNPDTSEKERAFLVNFKNQFESSKNKDRLISVLMENLRQLL